MRGLHNIFFAHGGRPHGFGGFAERGRDWTWDEGWREWGRPGFGGRGGPRVDRGDVKFLILSILQEGPKHGYEIIRTIEEKSQGAYTPSAGTIYPTLQLLEDLTYLTSRETDGRKVYTLTDAGRAYLAEHGDKAQTAWTRFGEGHGHGPWANFGSEEQRQVRDSLISLGRALFAEGRIFRASSAKLTRVADILQNARQQIEIALAESM
jgi:DNA-binding PadR family transcriptional regulator